MAVHAPALPAGASDRSMASDGRTRVSTFGAGDAAALAGSALSGFAIMWLALTQVLQFSSPAELGLAWYGAFIAVYYVVVRQLDGPMLASDRVMAVIVFTAGLAMVVPLVLILGYLVKRGVGGIHLNFFTETQAAIGPLDPATKGGAEHAIVGTLEQVGLAVVMSVPLGFLCAIFLNEIGGPLQRPVRIFIDAMNGVPTILAGLFVYAVWVSAFSWSGFAASLAISISMLPIITRTSEEVLRLVPDGLREASLALGGSEWRTTWSVVLPTARSGLITSVILGVARAIGETAPLIATAFGAFAMNGNPFSGAQAALPLYIYKQVTESSSANVQARAWAGAFVLMLLVLILFTLARLIGWSAARASSRRIAAATTES
ncbi:MAG TPA: phosphate ABC transporter permease PstA [Gaiellales bacterium]|jgi:phosphate transport system permease protein